FVIDLVALRKRLVPCEAVCRERNAAHGDKHSQCNRSKDTSTEPHSVSASRFVVFLFHRFISCSCGDLTSSRYARRTPPCSTCCDIARKFGPEHTHTASVTMQPVIRGF